MAPRKLNLSNTALLGKAVARASSLFGVDEGRSYRELPLERLQVNPNQPRKHFDPDELAALALSIEQHGLLQPVVVRETGADCYEIIAGQRRYHAFGLLKRDSIPAIVLESEDPATLALIENVQRVDLHALEIAHCLRELIDTRNLTQQQAGHLIGKSQAHVARLLGLLRLPATMLAELPAHREVPASVLLEIAEVEDPALRGQLWERAKTGLTIRDLRQAKQAAPPRSPSPPSHSHDSAFRGLGRHVKTLRTLRDEGVKLSAGQAETLRTLRQEIDALLAMAAN